MSIWGLGILVGTTTSKVLVCSRTKFASPVHRYASSAAASRSVFELTPTTRPHDAEYRRSLSTFAPALSSSERAGESESTPWSNRWT